MDHQEALRRGLVEQYLLRALSPSDRDEFEEHFFDCRECAEDLHATAAFLRSAERELGRRRVTAPARPAPKVGRFGFLWRPAFVAPAFAVLLLVIVYQNAVQYPRFDHPEVLPAVSLIGANSRGGPSPAVTVTRGAPILLSVDIPATKEFSSYACVLIAPSGATVWRVPVSAEQAKDTVSIRIPPADWRAGDYQLIVQGYADRAGVQPAGLARYHFTLHASN